MVFIVITFTNISKSLRYYFFCAEKTFIAANPIWILTDFNIISTIRCFYITTFASKFWNAENWTI